MSEKILIVDDHGLVRSGLRPILQAVLSQDCTILEAETLAETLDVIRANSDIDLVLLDLTLPDAHGLSALETVRAQFPSVPVAVLSGQEDLHLIQSAYRHNISGFVVKNVRAEVLVSAVRLILSGGVYVPPELLTAAMTGGNERKRTRAERGTVNSGSQLTPRQQEVLYLITKGCSNQEISDSVGATIGTVKSHVVGILRALGVHSRTQAISLVHDNPDLLGQYKPQSGRPTE